MHVGDRVMFVSVALAEALGISQDAVGLVTRVYERPADINRLDVLFPGSNTPIDRCLSEFVEVNALS